VFTVTGADEPDDVLGAYGPALEAKAISGRDLKALLLYYE
jgi:hypothetical protein